jgi:IclR family transcriptional regulator, acetate operon repressor
MPRNQPYPGTQAIRRAVSLLKAFSDDRPERTLVDLAGTVGLNKTTAYRALAALEREGLVQRIPDGDVYRLGPELIVLGARAVRSSDLRSLTRHELESLARDAGETATLEVPLEGEMMILDEVKAAGLVGVHAEIGTRWPLHATSTGKAFLAAVFELDGAAGLAEAGLQRALHAHTPHTLTMHDALHADLQRILDRGYATAYEELQPGYAAIASPIRNHERRPVGAISIGGPTSRVTKRRVRELGALVRLRAERISAALGAPEPLTVVAGA